MAVESVPLDGAKTRNARNTWLAPLTVLTGLVTMAALGSSVLHRAPVPVTGIESPGRKRRCPQRLRRTGPRPPPPN